MGTLREPGRWEVPVLRGCVSCLTFGCWNLRVEGFLEVLLFMPLFRLVGSGRQLVQPGPSYRLLTRHSHPQPGLQGPSLGIATPIISCELC